MWWINTDHGRTSRRLNKLHKSMEDKWETREIWFILKIPKTNNATWSGWSEVKVSFQNWTDVPATQNPPQQRSFSQEIQDRYRWWFWQRCQEADPEDKDKTRMRQNCMKMVKTQISRYIRLISFSIFLLLWKHLKLQWINKPLLLQKGKSVIKEFF